MTERRIALLIFVGLLLSYAYIFPRWLDWNQNSRIDLTAAIVAQGTLTIDQYVNNTGDYAEFNGHTYSDKTPGLSFLAIPVYAVTHRLAQIDVIRQAIIQLGQRPAAAATLNRPVDQIPDREFIFAASLIAATFVVVMIPSALLGALLYLFLGRFGYSARSRAMAVLAYALATPVFAYAAAFYSHQLTAVMLFAAFAWIHALRRRAPRCLEMLAMGGLLGLTIVVEVPSTPIVLLLAAYAIWIVRRPLPLGLIALGACVPLAIMGAYHWAIFGTPFTMAYMHHVRSDWREHFETGVLSADTIRLEAVWGMTFSSYRGLFYAAPILLVSIAGFVLLVRRSQHRLEWLISAFSVIGLLLIFSSSVDWYGGYTVGPRYIVAILPFLVWPLAAAFDRIGQLRPLPRRLLGLLMLGLIALSLLITVSLTTGGQYYTPDDVSNPLFDYSWPHILTGDVARNWGMIAGLRGGWSLLPLVILISAVFGVVWYTTRRKGQTHVETIETPDVR